MKKYEVTQVATFGGSRDELRTPPPMKIVARAGRARGRKPLQDYFQGSRDELRTPPPMKMCGP
jgi:hypothetical protein